MVEQYFPRARHLIRVTFIGSVLSVASNAAADTLNAIGNSGGGQLGQLLALTDDRQRMPDYHGSILPPQVKLARIYLHHYPESLEDDGFVEAYARHFFPEELASAQRSTDYKTSPFKRRSVINGGRTRLSNLDSSETLTLNIFMPAMLNTNQYDFDAQAFMAQNRNSRLPGRGASIFVGVQLKITGKPRAEGAHPPRCQLAAEVLSIDALEYLSTDDAIARLLPANVEFWINAEAAAWELRLAFSGI